MTYSIANRPHWTIDPTLPEEIEGAAALISWFGFVPDFHDAIIRRIAFEGFDGLVVLSAFRMTSEVDEQGFFVLDRHARVSLFFDKVIGVVFDCIPDNTIQELRIRRLAPEHLPVSKNLDATTGDYEVAFDDVCGGTGAIYARNVRIGFEREMAG